MPNFDPAPTPPAVPIVAPSPPSPSAPLPTRVLVVVNTLQPVSVAVAAHYMATRNIPETNRCPIQVAGSMADLDYLVLPPVYDAVKSGVRACVDRIGRPSVLYIVMTPGVPYRVWFGAAKARSIDAQVAALWADTTGQGTRNAYAAFDQSAANIYAPYVTFAAWRDTAGSVPQYSVWRLWGTEAEAKQMVDAARAVESAGGLKGTACFDAKYGSATITLPDRSYAASDNDLILAAAATRAAGLETVLDVNDAEFGTGPAPLRCEHAALYAGWYSYSHYNDAFTFTRGAIGWHLDSQSTTWSIEALKRGVIATSATIEEPLMGVYALAHPDGVVRDLLAGANVGDAFWRHTDYIDKIVQIGDPLYCPFCRR